MLRDYAIFLRRGVVSTSPNPHAGGPPLLGCLRLHIQDTRRPFPIRNPKTHHAVVTGTHFSEKEHTLCLH